MLCRRSTDLRQDRLQSCLRLGRRDGLRGELDAHPDRCNHVPADVDAHPCSGGPVRQAQPRPAAARRSLRRGTPSGAWAATSSASPAPAATSGTARRRQCDRQHRQRINPHSGPAACARALVQRPPRIGLRLCCRECGCRACGAEPARRRHRYSLALATVCRSGRQLPREPEVAEASSPPRSGCIRRYHLGVGRATGALIVVVGQPRRVDEPEGLLPGQVVHAAARTAGAELALPGEGREVVPVSCSCGPGRRTGRRRSSRSGCARSSGSRSFRRVAR